MMYQGIDLSRFKKVSGDAKSSTLRHSKGHEIKIAHASLSPEMQQRITQMPVHMAEGGEALDPETPAPVAPAEPAPEALPPKPAVMPVGGDVNVIGAPRRPALVTPQDFDRDNDGFADDLALGRIKPETMQSLFAKKDTLGKIGTIFGLIVGGAGAGLTKSPNALLAMMQKEIDNDLDAQKASNINAQNWYRASNEYERQKAEMQRLGAETKQLGAQTKMTEAQIGKIPAELKALSAQTRSYDADADLKATTVAKTRMQMAIFQQLSGIVDKMPPGPAKENAAATLQNVIGPAIQGDIATRNEQAAGQLNLRSAARGDLRQEPPRDEGGAGVDFEKLNQLAQLGTVTGDIGLPGGMSQGDVAKARQEAEAVSTNRAIAGMFAEAFNRMDQKFLAGQLNPNERDAEIAALGAQIAQNVAGGMTEKEFQRIVNGMFPKATDWGSAREAKFRHGIEQFRANEAGTPTLDQFKLKTPFPKFERERKKERTEKKAEGKKMPPDGTTGKTKDGKPVIVKDGKWVPNG